MQPNELHAKLFADFGDRVTTLDETAHLAFLDNAEDNGLDSRCCDALRKCVRLAWEHKTTPKMAAYTPPPYMVLELLAGIDKKFPPCEWYSPKRITLPQVWDIVRKAQLASMFDLGGPLDDGWLTDLKFLVKLTDGQHAKIRGYKNQLQAVGHRTCHYQDVLSRWKRYEFSNCPAVVVAHQLESPWRRSLMFDASSGRFLAMSSRVVEVVTFLRPQATLYMESSSNYRHLPIALVENDEVVGLAMGPLIDL